MQMPGQTYPGQVPGQPYPGQPGMPGAYPQQPGMPGAYPQPGQPGYVQQTTVTTTSQSGYPQTGYPQQPGMPGAYPGQPGMPGAMPGYPQQPGMPGAMVSIPGQWARPQFQYNMPYSRQEVFIIPYGIDPVQSQRMTRASQIFRTFDRNFSGTLSFKEWKKAMKALGYYMNKYDKERLFFMIDSNRSGQIDEREFCEYWALYGY
eukprot:TRINITY_DN12_c0_g1_i2.p1 TRINITY_DN12_c0_g1~~TRINITY_DN12_c0_g1_i2.p1  ORF type:complete len:232 (+),score=47.56 TRINITY_DN12_c0_g1_i2:85-696(+)